MAVLSIATVCIGLCSALLAARAALAASRAAGLGPWSDAGVEAFHVESWPPGRPTGAFQFEVHKRDVAYIELWTEMAARAAGYPEPDSLNRVFLSLTDARNNTYASPDFLPKVLPDDCFPLVVAYKPHSAVTSGEVILEKMRRRADVAQVDTAAAAAFMEARSRWVMLEETTGLKKDPARSATRRPPGEAALAHPRQALATTPAGGPAEMAPMPEGLVIGTAGELDIIRADPPLQAPVPNGSAEPPAGRTLEEAWGPPRCASYGCGTPVNRSRPCQCHGACERERTCCSDYLARCLVEAPARPQPEVNCTTQGGNCVVSHCCADADQICFEKDKGWATCALQCRPGRHPEDGLFQTPWSCRMLSAARMPSLLCFAGMRSLGEEVDLIRSQHEKGAGLFQCDAYLVFSDAPVEIGPGLKAVPLIHFQASSGVPGALTSTWLNREAFAEAWDMVYQLERPHPHDWVVKVDPDSVFFPQVLQRHLWGLRRDIQDTSRGVYILNCAVAGPLQLYGSLEILSGGALGHFGLRGTWCDFGLQAQMGEDMWLQRCLDALDVLAFTDTEVLSDSYCPARPWRGSPCTFGWASAYHPKKTREAWWRCWSEAMQGYTDSGLRH